MVCPLGDTRRSLAVAYVDSVARRDQAGHAPAPTAQRGRTMSSAIRVAVTGAGGQVAYAMLARLASGEVFGASQKVVLHLLDIPKRADWQPPSPTARQPLDVAEGNA